jgi:hypothetical protein
MNTTTITTPTWKANDLWMRLNAAMKGLKTGDKQMAVTGAWWRWADRNGVSPNCESATW